MKRWTPLVLLGVAAVTFLGFGLRQAWTDAPTFDEPVYVASGLAAVLHHDLAFNDEHPPLPKVLAVLPVLLAHPVIPSNGAWDQNNERTYSATFVRAQLRAGRLQVVTMASRLVPLLEAVSLAFVLYLLGRDLFGRAAGTFAGLLWLLSPFVLGLGHLDSLDIAFALAVGAWSWALLQWIRQPDGHRTMVVGLLSGAAVLTDVTGLILVLLAVATVGVIGWRHSPRRGLQQCTTVLVVTWASVWLVYALLDVHVLTDPTVVLPGPYLHGLSYLAEHDTIAGPGYLLGAAWTGGRWWYWPGSLLVKTVPVTLVAMVVGPFGLVAVDRATRRRVALVVGLPALCLLGLTVLTPRDIGLRYLLPVIALWLVAASSIVGIARRWVAGSVVLVAIVAIAGVATVRSAPNSLSWVSVPFRPAVLAVTNSDVDWGQDLYRLQQWVPGRDARVAYFGPRGLGVQALSDSRPLLGTDPTRVTGWVAVSATSLTSDSRGQLAWLRGYCSVGHIGGSILLYRFALPPTSRAGPTRPVGLCPISTGGWSKRT